MQRAAQAKGSRKSMGGQQHEVHQVRASRVLVECVGGAAQAPIGWGLEASVAPQEFALKVYDIHRKPFGSDLNSIFTVTGFFTVYP